MKKLSITVVLILFTAILACEKKDKPAESASEAQAAPKKAKFENPYFENVCDLITEKDFQTLIDTKFDTKEEVGIQKVDSKNRSDGYADVACTISRWSAEKKELVLAVNLTVSKDRAKERYELDKNNPQLKLISIDGKEAAYGIIKKKDKKSPAQLSTYKNGHYVKFLVLHSGSADKFTKDTEIELFKAIHNIIKM